jgi:hypothetical protein
LPPLELVEPEELEDELLELEELLEELEELELDELLLEELPVPQEPKFVHAPEVLVDGLSPWFHQLA